MQDSTLKLSLAGCGLLAFTPVLTWIYGAIFNDRWRETITSIGVTLPIGLGLAAILLAVHGLLVNREVADVLADDIEYAMASMASASSAPSDAAVGVTAGVTGTSARPRTPPAAPARTEAPVDDEPASDRTGRMKGKLGGLAKKAGKRGKRRITSRGSSVARRELRSRMPRF